MKLTLAVVTTALLALSGLTDAATIPRDAKKAASKKDSASTSASNSSSSGGGDFGLPSGGLKLKNGVPMGWLPDVAAKGNMPSINSKLGMNPASTYGWYAQITGSSWDGSQLLSQKDDIVKSKAVFIPAVMPTVDMSKIDTKVAADVAKVMKEFTDAGVEVWLRFAHEMNWYVKDGTYHGNPDSFQKAWANVAAAVKGNPKVKMFWSPNWDSPSNIAPWWPKDASTVDIVGMDVYPKDQQTFDKAYGPFYDAFAKKYNKKFVIGETGPGKGDNTLKEYWLKQIATADLSKYPNYLAACWFEYYKGFDFRLVIGQPANIISETKSQLK